MGAPPMVMAAEVASKTNSERREADSGERAQTHPKRSLSKSAYSQEAYASSRQTSEWDHVASNVQGAARTHGVRKPARRHHAEIVRAPTQLVELGTIPVKRQEGVQDTG